MSAMGEFLSTEIHAKAGLSIETELGVECQCVKCLEFWPRDEEFFRSYGGVLGSICRSCIYEQAKEYRKSRKRKYQPKKFEMDGGMLTAPEVQALAPEFTLKQIVSLLRYRKVKTLAAIMEYDPASPTGGSHSKNPWLKRDANRGSNGANN